MAGGGFRTSITASIAQYSVSRGSYNSTRSSSSSVSVSELIDASE